MNQAAQHISPNPALDFAEGILEETNNALELIEILREISEGIDEEATTNDRITATNILADRGLGKCPKQTPVLSPAEGANTDLGANRESPPAVPHNEPESPRLVTQIKDALQDSLGPAPTPSTTQQTPGTHSPLSTIHYPLSTSHYPLQSVIQQHILEITNNGQTLRDTLLEIARSPDDPKVKPCHRARAARLLLDRLLGTDPTSGRIGVSLAHAPDAAEAKPKVRYVDPEALAEVRAEIQRMKDEGILTPDPNARKIDISMYRMPKDFDITPYAKEEAAAFWAEIDLRLERQKQWPEIEERRRKKLAQIYPSHTDGKPPEP